MSQKYEFLTDEWFGAVKDLLAEGAPELPEALRGIVTNVDIKDVGVLATYRGCWFEPGFSDDARRELHSQPVTVDDDLSPLHDGTE